MHTSFPTFCDFFRDLWNYAPFPWQNELAQRAVSGDWPDFITAPTGSGKTACLDAAIYALAAQAHLPPSERNAPRRIFFIVNRRIIVDEAFQRASYIATALASGNSNRPACSAVADALRTLNPTPPGITSEGNMPLDCVQLRGAIYRDQRWARSLLQPTVIASTIDQVGSRLLFRGYGVSPNASPIHAALVANDALWLLDEAHISRPFAETVGQLKRYREYHHARHPSAISTPPLRWVQLTATPPREAQNVHRLGDADYENPTLRDRLNATKPARLCLSEAKSKAKQTEAMADSLIEEACSIINQSNPASLAVMVNRVATARLVADKLNQEINKKNSSLNAKVTLLIGRMRPLERDFVTSRLQEAIRSAAQRSGQDLSGNAERPPIEIVVATQCLEVGADLDFDALVTECASLDALRQRFGRLNRSGRNIPAQAAIVMPAHLVETDPKKLEKLTQEDKPLDPIYGNALSATWNWLQSVAQDGTVDFGLSAIRLSLETLDDAVLSRLQAPTSHAPRIFPAYLDAWAQTSPAPFPTPEPALFLHGKQPSRPDVLVVWRADLQSGVSQEAAIHDLSLCPPSQPEALPVPLPLLRAWLFSASTKSSGEVDTGDLLADASAVEIAPDRSRENKPRCDALLWQGARNNRWISAPGDVFPGATIVLPASAGGWHDLGHLPTATDTQSVDCAENAFLKSKDRAIVRLYPERLATLNGGEAWEKIKAYAGNPDQSLSHRELTTLLGDSSNDELLPETLRASFRDLLKTDFEQARYFDEKGIVLTSKRRLRRNSVLSQGEDDQDDWSRSITTTAVTLADHTQHVVDLVDLYCNALGVPESIQQALQIAASLHDWGKADPRFQALLLGGNLFAAYGLDQPLAKSQRKYTSAADHARARQRANLPNGFRHELASIQLASATEQEKSIITDSSQRDLALHLIASHHGYARPFAPVIDDPDAPAISINPSDRQQSVSISAEKRLANPPHRLDSGIPERFWNLLRLHNPWGLAFLESILRLADQQASEAESEGWYADNTHA